MQSAVLTPFTQYFLFTVTLIVKVIFFGPNLRVHLSHLLMVSKEHDDSLRGGTYLAVLPMQR